MGAVDIVREWTGTDYREGFKVLCAEADYEYGRNGYTGELNTMALERRPPVHIADRFSKAAEKAAEKYMNDHPGKKWYARVLDLGVVEYDLITYCKRPQNAEARWQTFFVVKADGQRLDSFKTIAEARRYLETVIERADGSVDWYCIEKVPENIGGTALSTSYERTCRTLKTKPKRIPKGATLRERHRFVYYGLASC